MTAQPHARITDTVSKRSQRPGRIGRSVALVPLVLAFLAPSGAHGQMPAPLPQPGPVPGPVSTPPQPAPWPQPGPVPAPVSGQPAPWPQTGPTPAPVSGQPAPWPQTGPTPAPGPAIPAPPPQQVGLPPGMDPAMVQALQMLSGQEKQEFGVPPTPELHPGAPHGPTPSSIPGGRVIDTLNLVALLSAQPPVPVLIVDALGGPQRLPNAMQGAFAAQPGSFQDQIQQQFAQMLQAATGGNPSLPVIVYCYDPNCWMSYNAALRAIRAGYQNVFWYRGGLWAWEQARLPVQS